jgi:cell division GTPase FtsZ
VLFRSKPGRSIEELVAASDDLIVVDADVLLRDAARASLAKRCAKN